MSYIIPALNDVRNANADRLNVNGNNWNDNNGYAFGIALALRPIMKTYKNLYERIISYKNLILAWEKAKKANIKGDS